MTLQEERLTFLNDMVYYYGSNVKRRAVFGEPHFRQSKYKTEDGRCCPVGRFIPKEKNPEKLNGSLKNLWISNPENNTRIFVEAVDYVPHKIYMLGPKFLDAVTGLHDTDSYWYKFGLNYLGQMRYNQIVKDYCDIVLDYENYF